MKRTTYLKIMGIGWCVPQLLLVSPFALLALACGGLESFFTWARMNAESVSEKVSTALFPPPWWPSHRYFNELETIRAAWRKEAADRMHNRVSKMEEDES